MFSWLHCGQRAADMAIAIRMDATIKETTINLKYFEKPTMPTMISTKIIHIPSAMNILIFFAVFVKSPL